MIKINIVLDATKLRLKNETAKKFLGFFIGKSRFSVAFRLHLDVWAVAFQKRTVHHRFFTLKPKKTKNKSFCQKKWRFKNALLAVIAHTKT